MNVLFLAENPLFYVEYASRMENANLPFWTAHNVNDLHVLFSRMTIDLVLADYNFTDFNKFDVFKHINEKQGNFIFLFLNEPRSISNLFIHWEDKINECWPNLWTTELESLLRVVANQPFLGDSVLEPHRVQDLLTRMKVGEAQQQVQLELSRQNLVVADNKIPEKPVEQQELIKLKREPVWEPYSDEERKLVAEFIKVKKVCKMSFSEFLLLDLFRRRKDALVPLSDMLELLDMKEDENNVRKIYRYIHGIRNYLEKQEESKQSLVRIKKGVYSLVCEDFGQSKE